MTEREKIETMIEFYLELSGFYTDMADRLIVLLGKEIENEIKNNSDRQEGW